MQLATFSCMQLTRAFAKPRHESSGPVFAIGVLAVAYTVVLLAGFFAPYEFDEQNRSLALAPPTPIHFRDLNGRFHVRPFTYGWVLRAGTFNQYEENRSKRHFIRFFVLGAQYTILGNITSRRHLFGTGQETPIFVIGSDEYGRDQFSRLLYGGRISLFAGFLGAGIAVSFGLLLGGLAGYYGHIMDEFVMRATEVFLTVPWLYLLLAVRVALPLNIGPEETFFLLITLLGMIGWARPARLIRGVVLAAKHQDYVLAARSFGASDGYLLRTHVLPQISSVAMTQGLLFVPQYILAEVTLSFFGLGISEPVPSWGNMLAHLQSYFMLRSCWWMCAPMVALIIVLFAYHRILQYPQRELQWRSIRPPKLEM